VSKHGLQSKLQVSSKLVRRRYHELCIEHAKQQMKALGSKAF
jgi:hypothetical protein